MPPPFAGRCLSRWLREIDDRKEAGCGLRDRHARATFAKSRRVRRARADAPIRSRVALLLAACAEWQVGHVLLQLQIELV